MKNTKPDRKTLQLIKEGLLTFYPDIYFVRRGEEVKGVSLFRKDEFDYLLTELFGTENAIFAAEAAGNWVRVWSDYYEALEKGEEKELPEEEAPTVPENLDELVAAYEKSLEQKKAKAVAEKEKKDFLLSLTRLVEKEGPIQVKDEVFPEPPVAPHIPSSPPLPKPKVESQKRPVLSDTEMVEKEGLFEAPGQISKETEKEEKDVKKTKLETRPEVTKAEEQKVTRPSPPTPKIKKEAFRETVESLGISFSPSKSRGFSSFVSKLVLAPIDLVSRTAGRKGNEAATVASLPFSIGISSKALKSAIEKAVTSGKIGKGSGTFTRLTKFANLIEGVEKASPVASYFARIAYGSQPVELVFDIEKIGLPQTQIYLLTFSQQNQVFVLSKDYFEPRGIVDNVSQRLFGNLSDKAIEKLVKKGGKKVTEKLVAQKTAGEVSKRAAKEVAKRATEEAVKKGFLATIVKSIAAFFGSAGTFIGAVIGWIIGELIMKVVAKIWNFIKKHKNEIVGALGILFAAVLVRRIRRFIRGLFRSLPARLIRMLLRIFIAFILLVVATFVILFIINSGAYITPPKEASLVASVESPYIGVTKEANPSGPFANSDLPITVSYTITITAKKGTLTNISFSDSCSVIKEEETLSCPEPKNVEAGFGSDLSPSGSFPPPPPDAISPVESFVITFQMEFNGSQFEDSLVQNTFTVVADSPDQAGALASAAESVIIGDPPLGCFTIVGDNWPDTFRTNLESAIAKLVSDHPAYVAKVCAAGEVPVCYDAATTKYWGNHDHSPSCDIRLYSGGLGTPLNAEYILTHEAGHHINRISPAYYSQYVNYPGVSSERPICSYAATNYPGEAFAEAAALYGSEKPLSSFTGCVGVPGSFQSNYPKHWQFENDIMFK